MRRWVFVETRARYNRFVNVSQTFYKVLVSTSFRGRRCTRRFACTRGERLHVLCRTLVMYLSMYVCTTTRFHILLYTYLRRKRGPVRRFFCLFVPLSLVSSLRLYYSFGFGNHRVVKRLFISVSLSIFDN